MVANWKLEASTTATSSGPNDPASAVSGSPRFPQARAGMPWMRSASASSVTTVDLPLVPVTATSRSAGSPSARYPSSSSPQTGIRARRAAFRMPVAGATPGLVTTSDIPARSDGGWPPP